MASWGVVASVTVATVVRSGTRPSIGASGDPKTNSYMIKDRFKQSAHTEKYTKPCEQATLTIIITYSQATIRRHCSFGRVCHLKVLI